ncbi:MAG: hypothetical protein KIT22_09965, partial [Verrucomicrobiae bacterium]|nr:hypothetical protein [Verrucomicrobiae bacterium]
MSLRFLLFGVLMMLWGAPALLGAERLFDFSTNQPGTAPAGFKSFIAGEGKPGDWQVILASVPPLLEPITDKAVSHNQIPVVSQVSRDATDERYPILYWDGDRFGDFTFTTRFRMSGGALEQMAGVVFRLVDEKNFCVVRASA